MPETFAQYLERWLKQSTERGLNNPLVKMPVKRFRRLTPEDLATIGDGGSLIIGTTSDPISRNLQRNFQTRIRERGEHCAFICQGSVEMTVAGAAGQQPRAALLPVCLKRISIQTTGDKVRVTVADDEVWRFNPVLESHLRAFGIGVRPGLADKPVEAINGVKAQLGNRATQVAHDAYVGLFSSQQMVLQERLTEPPLRQALAGNPVVRARVAGTKVERADLGEVTDEGLEGLGLVLPCDDSQLRVVQLSDQGCSLQVEGPPGTGKSQTIANIISNALYYGRNALLVCDKKVAIAQVAERLSNCGLSPALLNLHDEDLDKRAFLEQATAKFPSSSTPVAYPFDQLRETRKILNDRVQFGRAIAHPCLQVAKRQALAGLIQLRKDLRTYPNVHIANWKSLSKERLAKLLSSVAEWPGLAEVLTDAANVWNRVRPEAFDNNPFAPKEIEGLAHEIVTQLESLDEIRESMAVVGIELPLESDTDAKRVLELVGVVLARPACHPKIAGNPQFSLAELDRLQSEWNKRERLRAARHPLPLAEVYPPEAKHYAEELRAAEGAESWQDLSEREVEHGKRRAEIQGVQGRYVRLCTQIGLVSSPFLKTRRAQLQAVLALGEFGGLIPRDWWNPGASPVLLVNGWLAKLQGCIDNAKAAPLPLHFLALERVSSTHWQHVEAMAEHGFNYVSYCLRFVNDRKCKYALRQVYPDIPTHGFKQWREVTLHAVAARGGVQALRSAANAHVILRQLTENYLAVGHEVTPNHESVAAADALSRMTGEGNRGGGGRGAEVILDHADVARLNRAAAIVEQWRLRNDLFEVVSIHWQTFWESPSANLLDQVKGLLSDLDALALPDQASDNLEDALNAHERAQKRIRCFLGHYEKQDGDRTQPILAGLAAQQEFARSQERLVPLARYLDLHPDGRSSPDWEWLRGVIAWRDLFERLRGRQNLDVDSPLWARLRMRLDAHRAAMAKADGRCKTFFEGSSPATGDYESIRVAIGQVLGDLPRHPLWLEKKRWQQKIAAFPELKALWAKTLDGEVAAEQATRLFCFNLLRLCEPAAKPSGPELKQTLNSFAEHDDHLSSWVLDRLRSALREYMERAAESCAQSEVRLRHLAGLITIRGTVREIVNTNLDYLLAAKRCWMMSPTSLANLIESRIFEQFGVPFDLVIFDEASQIRVLDGLLAMSFGKQAIIVGDKHQLPPTDFFAAFAHADDDAADDVPGSLLDEFEGVFEDGSTHVMLMSHYRSETPDLIRFSNDWFYKGKLEMYPPAHISGLGRRLHYVPNGNYSETAGQRSNPAEAEEVVNLIELHVREWPQKSLGVVTMNIPQMELIDERLQFFQSDAVRDFCADESRFFLRNLETVQGDAMDRIILSLTYGRNPEGRFSASVLGPLTKSGGERRLNVAITRSRSGMIVVSSLRAADLAASGAQSRGFQCLKDLLADLENTEQVRNYGIGNERFKRQIDGVSNVVYCDSPFEEQVVEFLENEGYEIECQYGAGKYRLDIVVKERGRNLLAIECDGAAYHRSLVARTRDRARQRILEKLGWRVHRVWSTNWWHFESQEKEAIIVAINAAREVAQRQTRVRQ